MYCLYLLALFFLLGIDAKQSTEPGKRKHDDLAFEAKLQSQWNSSTVITNLAMTPNQMGELENALNNVVNNLFGPQKRKLSLRTTEDENAGIIFTLKVISDAIFKEIKRLFEKFGLISPTKLEPFDNFQPIESSLKATVYHQLLSIPLKLVPYWQAAQKQIKNHFQKKNYGKMGYKTAKFDFQIGYGVSTDQLKISAVMSSLAMYGGGVYDCLEMEETSAFDLKRTLGNLTNFPPEVTGTRLRNRLEKPVLKCPEEKKGEYNQFHALICHALAENLRRDYYDCLVEIKRVDKCVYRKINKAEVTERVMEKPKALRSFLQNIKSLDDSCKNADKGMNVLVSCNLKSKANLKRRNVFPYMVDFFMGDLNKSPKLRRMANKVGLMITKSRMGSEILNEIVTLIDIYKRGVEKKARLMKISKGDIHKKSIFTRISDILSQYRQYVLDMTYKTVAHVNNAMTSVQKILIDSASTLVGQDLTPNFQTLRSWTNFVDSIFIEMSHNRSQFPPIAQHKINSDQFVNDLERSQTRGLIKVPNEVGFIKSPHEEPLNKLIGSMKYLGRPSQPRRSTALVSLANTFLLATMFYECIALLAGAIYHDDNSSMSSANSAENDDPWQSSRDKRSSPSVHPEDFQPQGGEEQGEPLSLTTETDMTTATTVHSDNEKTQESVENLSGIPVPEKLDTVSCTESSSCLT